MVGSGTESFPSLVSHIFVNVQTYPSTTHALIDYKTCLSCMPYAVMNLE
jgi:hypothetical protein